jgi:uncharacterized protein YraI
MNKKARLFVAASIAVTTVPSLALAAMMAHAVTDLNVRSGPGPEYPVIGFIKTQEPVTMIGCIQGSLWCQITHKGKDGWAYSQYLATESAGNRVILSERPAAVAVPSVTYNTTGSGAAIATGAVAGALVAGPVGAVVGGVAGAAIVPPQQVQTYVTTNPGEPVYLNGEVVVGAGLPETVPLRQVPDYNYRYVYVNGQPVLVDPASRRIVYVYR